MLTTSRRRVRVSSSRASARARPMCPWLARAAKPAIVSEMPSLLVRKAATSRVPGVASVRVRQRERIVGSTSCTVGAHSSQIVLGVGSSIALRRALPVRGFSGVPSRSASSITTICQRPIAGNFAADITRSRMSST